MENNKELLNKALPAHPQGAAGMLKDFLNTHDWEAWRTECEKKENNYN